MTKREINRLTKTLNAVESTKLKIAELRDKLRDQVDEVEGIIESLDQAVDEFDLGRRSFQDGIDAASKYV